MKESEILANVEKIKDEIVRKRTLEEMISQLVINDDEKYSTTYSLSISKEGVELGEVVIYFWDIEKIKEILRFSLNLSEGMITTYLQNLNMSVYLQEGEESKGREYILDESSNETEEG